MLQIRCSCKHHGKRWSRWRRRQLRQQRRQRQQQEQSTRRRDTARALQRQWRRFGTWARHDEVVLQSTGTVLPPLCLAFGGDAIAHSALGHFRASQGLRSDHRASIGLQKASGYQWQYAQHALGTLFVPAAVRMTVRGCCAALAMSGLLLVCSWPAVKCSTTTRFFCGGTAYTNALLLDVTVGSFSGRYLPSVSFCGAISFAHDGVIEWHDLVTENYDPDESSCNPFYQSAAMCSPNSQTIIQPDHRGTHPSRRTVMSSSLWPPSQALQHARRSAGAHVQLDGVLGRVPAPAARARHRHVGVAGSVHTRADGALALATAIALA